MREYQVERVGKSDHALLSALVPGLGQLAQ